MRETLKNQIIAWVAEQPYWFKFAAQKFLNGYNLSDEIIDETYELFLEDQLIIKSVKNREEIIFQVEEIIDAEEDILILEEIKEIENVNALVENQVIPINKNLTIIYGQNGTGKSGYIRLLNTAFKSRGDKNIIPNIFKDKTGPVNCKFKFRNSDSSYDLEYPKDLEKLEFLKFSVHDTESIRVHLEEENQLTFIPQGFDFFNKAVALYLALRQKLQDDIARNRPSNDFIFLFSNENIVSDFIRNLDHNADETELNNLEGIDDENIQSAMDLNLRKAELISLNIPEKIDQLRTVQSQLDTFISQIGELLNHINPTAINSYESLINSYDAFRELSVQEGLKNLEVYNISDLGSSQWREFITASKEYVDLLYKSNSDHYPTKGDLCIYCLQPLQAKETALIKAYWVLLKSESQKELQRINNRIRDAEKLLKGINPIKFDNSTSLFTYINNFDFDLAQEWQSIVSEMDQAKIQIIENLSERKIKFKINPFAISVDKLLQAKEEIKIKIGELTIKNTKAELGSIQDGVDLVASKMLLSKIHDKVLKHIKKHKWAFEAERCLSLLRTNSITLKEGDLFAEHITENYTNIFNSECELLDAPKFIVINQRNVKGQTIRKLQISGLNANKILSEGEQRAVGLADFLTEMQLNKGNKGIIFDDPVTSLDHHRREKIADRLVNEAKKRQVIIFTHDISFLIKLQILAEKKQDIQFSVLSIRKSGGKVGIIKNDLPWIAQKVKDRIGYLKNDLVKLNKLEQLGSEDDYNFAVKQWYVLLRESWERAVEERLFKGVVQRFSPEIQTLRLKKIEINSNLIEEVNDGMTQASKWAHDQPTDLNPTLPTCKEILDDLSKIEEFARKCDAA